MYGQETTRPPRRSLEDIFQDTSTEPGEASRPAKPRTKAPRRSLTEIAGLEPYGPEVTPEMTADDKWRQGLNEYIGQWRKQRDQIAASPAPASSVSGPKPKTAAPASKPKPNQFEDAVNAIAEINRRKNQAADLFRDAGNVPEGAARTAMQAQAQATLDDANRLGRESAKRHKGAIEVGFGTDADPASGRQWVYAKPLNPEVASRYNQRTATEQRAKDVETYRREYEASNPISRFAQKVSTGYLSDRPDKTPEEEKELSIRREAMGIGEMLPPGWLADKAGRVARATVGAIPSAASGLANISDTIYRRAQDLTGNRLPQSADWAPVVEPISREMENAVAPVFPVDPKRNEDFSSKVASGFGSAAGFGTISKVAGAARIPSQIAVGTAGAGMGVDEIVQEARAAGFDPARDPGRWDRMVALAGASGMTEIFGFGKMLDRWGLKRQFTKRALEVLEEGGQEALQQFLGNVNAAYIGQYEKDRGLGKDVIENAVIGGIVGGGAQAADIASDYLRRPAAVRATQQEPLAPLSLTPSVPAGTQTQILGVPASGKFRSQPKSIQQEAAPIVDMQTVAAREAAGIPNRPVASPATTAAAIPATPQPTALLFPEAQATQQPQQDLSALSPQDRTAALLDQLRRQKEGRAQATLEQSLNKEFSEAGALIGTATQSWDADRPTAELMATTGAQRLKPALQNLQKAEPYVAELAAVSQGTGQPGPYIAAAQQIQQQLDQVDSLFRLDAERERQAKELQAEAEKAQKKAEKESAKQAKFEAREQLKLDREMQVEQRRAEIQQRRDDATAKRMQIAETAKVARRKQLEEQRRQSRDAKVQQRADVELQRLARHDAALKAADSAGQRHQEYLNQGQVPEAISELIVQQNQLRDAVRLLPATPESQNVKADLNRYQGQIGNRIGDLRKQTSGKTGPVTEAIPPLLRSDAVVNKDGGVPELPSFYEPGAIFDKLNPSLGDVEESSTPLLTAVRRAGGISNDEISSGELRRLGTKESGTTGLVNNRGGLAPDRMREAMAEAGYLADDSTVDDLYQAIEGELRAGQRRSQPQESIADFYDRWEAEQSDAETGGRGDGESRAETSAEKSEPQSAIRNPQSSRQSIEEFADDVEAGDLEALQRAISRSQRDNPRPYGERTRPGEPGSGLVSFSQYAELERRNVEQEQALYNNEPTSETFQDAVDWITEDAAKAGIGRSHVDAMVAYALNWHGEKAFWESQGLSIEATQQTVEDLDASIRGDLRRIAALPDIYRTAVESEIAALDSLFDDADAVNLLERAARGEDNAVNEFTEYAQQYALSSDTISGLVEARRPADPKRSLVKNAESQSDTRNTGSRPASSEKRKPVRLTKQERELLGSPPSEIRDEDFDRHLMAVEDIWARAVRGEVDIDPQRIYNPAKWVAESEAPPRGAGVLAQLRAERSRRRDENRLPARENLITINRYMNADLSALAAPKKEGRKSRLQEILDATRITIEKDPSGAPAGWMEQVRDLDKRAKIAQASYEARIVSHPNPAIDGKPILAETEDGRVVVANPENLSGVSIVKNRDTQQNRENAIIPGQNAVSGRSSQAGSGVAADDDRLGKRSLSGSERGAGPDQRTAAEAGVSGLPAGSRRSDAGAGSLGTDRADQPIGSGGTAQTSAKLAESGRSAQPNNLSQSDSARSSGEDRRVPGQRPSQPGQSKGAATGTGSEPGRLAERADQAIQRGSQVEWDNRGIKRGGQVMSVKDGVATIDIGYDETDTVPLSQLRLAPKVREQAARSIPASEVFSGARIQFKSGKRGQAGTLYADENALDVLRAAYEQVFGHRVEFSNVNLNAEASQRIARALMEESGKEGRAPEAGRKLRQIAREFSQAANSGQTVSVVSIAEGRRFSDIKVSRRHELFHDAQEGLRNSRGFLVKHKYGRQLIEGLSHYSFEDRTVEAAAFIAGGQAVDFGLTDEQGAEFLRDYFDDIVAENGREALERFVSLAPQVQSALKAKRQKHDIRRESRTVGERATGAEAGRRTGTPGSVAAEGERVPGRDGGIREQKAVRKGRRFSFGALENEPSGTVLASGLGGLQGFQRGPQPKSSPYREIFDEHKPLVADPYKLQDHTIEEILSAGAKGTLPGARALHWANKLKLKGAADRLANRQADFISRTIEQTNDMIAASEAMRAAETGSVDYKKAKQKFDNSRLKIADALAKAGEYTTIPGYAAKTYKSSLLSAPHIHLFNMLEQVFKMPLHQAQRVADAIVPASILNKFGIPYEKAVTDFRGLVPAIEAEFRGLGAGAKEIPRDVLDMFRYGITRQMHMADDAEQGHAGGTDKFELGHRAKMLPGLDQVLNFIGRSHGAADVAFTNLVNATAIHAQANAIARKLGRANNLSKEEMKTLARDLAERPSALMVTLASDATLRFKLDYPTLAYDALQKLRDLPGTAMGKATEKGVGKAADSTWKAAMDFMVPFSKIPLAAVDTYLFRYSPVAFGRVAGRMAMAKGGEYAGRYKGEFAKQRFGEDTAELLRQGLVGSLSWVLLGALGSFGYLSFTGGGEDDKDRPNVKNLREALRVPYGPEVRAGDTAFNLNRMGPLGQAAGIATRIAEAQKPRTDPKTGEPEEAGKRIARTVNAAKDALIFNNPLGQAAKDIAGDDSHSTSAGQYVAGKLRGFVPGLARDIAKIQSPTKRMPEESSTLGRLKGDLQSGIPVDVGFGSRDQMTERLDAFGRPIEEQNPFKFWRNIPRNPQLEEMERLGVGFSKPKRDKGETAAEYNRKITGYTDPATGEHVPGSADNLQKALRRIAEQSNYSEWSDRAKAHIYAEALTTDEKAKLNISRMEKLSEESAQIEYEIEALRADAYESLRQLPSYQRLREAGKKAARKEIDDQLKLFRAKAESASRNKKTGRVTIRREKMARLPEYDPLALARMAVTSAQP